MFFDPFQILQKIRQVAYKLALPENSLVHPIFHVSQLKQVVGSKYQVTSSIPTGLSAGARESASSEIGIQWKSYSDASTDQVDCLTRVIVHLGRS
jgi:hypothetical protein